MTLDEVALVFGSFTAAMRQTAEAVRDFSQSPTPFQTHRSNDETNNRAVALLLSQLDDQQRSEYQSIKRFDVIGGDTGDVYTITQRQSYNVIRVRDGVELCVQPESRSIFGHNYPMADVMLMQKLMIEVDETRFLQVANRRGFPRLRLEQEPTWVSNDGRVWFPGLDMIIPDDGPRLVGVTVMGVYDEDCDNLINYVRSNGGSYAVDSIGTRDAETFTIETHVRESELEEFRRLIPARLTHPY